MTISILAYLPTAIINTDKPVHLALLTTLCSATSLLVISKRTQSHLLSRSRSPSQYGQIPLQELPNGQDKIDKEKQRIHNYALSSAALFGIILAATVVLSFRIDLQRRLLLASECSTRSVEVWLPFLVAVYDALRFQHQKHSRRSREDDDDSSDDDDLDATAYDDLSQSVTSAFLSSRWHYLPSAFLLSLGCYLVAGLWLTSESSHVCPLLSTDVNMVPRLQLLALFLDLALAIAVLELTLGGMLPSSPLLATPTSWAVVLTLTSVVWAVVTIVVYIKQPENRPWLLMQDDSFSSRPLFSLICQALFLTALCISTLYSVRTNPSENLARADSSPDHERWTFTYVHCPDSFSHTHTRLPLHLVRQASLSTNIIPELDLVLRAYLLCMVNV